MSARSPWVAVLIAAAWSLAPSASAQGTAGTSGSTSAGGLGVTPISIGSTTASTIGKIYLNAANCANNDDVVFQLDGLSTSLANVDIYLGENCNSAANRTSTVTTACTYVKTVETNHVSQKFLVKLQADEILPGCPAGLESIPKIWFLNVSSPRSSEEATVYAVFLNLNVDTAPPGAPYSLTGGEGGSVITVGWKSTETNLQGFVVFIDTSGMSASTTDTTVDASTPPASNGGAGGSEAGAGGGEAGAGGSEAGAGGSAATPDSGTGAVIEDSGVPRVSLTDGATISSGACGPSLLVPGADPLNLPSAVNRKRINERTASGVDIVPGDLDGARFATIAVSAVDIAGNQGPLSNLACVRVVATTGFFDRYKKNGGTAVGGCPCSAMGPARAEEAWPVGLAVLALGLSSRRRRTW